MRSISLTILIIFILAILILRPVPQPNEDNTYTEKVKVDSILIGSSSDVIFLINNYTKQPYINRGVELGIEVKEFRENILMDSVYMTFIRHWTPLSSDRSIVRVTLLNGKHIFDRL